MKPVLLTVEDAAQALGLGRSKVYELVGSGALRSVKIGRLRRIPVQALGEFVDSVHTSDQSVGLSTEPHLAIDADNRSAYRRQGEAS